MAGPLTQFAQDVIGGYENRKEQKAADELLKRQQRIEEEAIKREEKFKQATLDLRERTLTQQQDQFFSTQLQRLDEREAEADAAQKNYQSFVKQFKTPDAMMKFIQQQRMLNPNYRSPVDQSGVLASLKSARSNLLKLAPETFRKKLAPTTSITGVVVDDKIVDDEIIDDDITNLEKSLTEDIIPLPPTEGRERGTTQKSAIDILRDKMLNFVGAPPAPVQPAPEIMYDAPVVPTAPPWYRLAAQPPSLGAMPLAPPSVAPRGAPPLFP